MAARVLELDESERAFTGEEQRDAIDRALEIIRNRVDQFGVSEPLIQKVGDERIIVELPGIQDEDRAKSLVQQAAYLEFQLVVDGREAIDQIEALDAALAGRALPTPAAAEDTTAAASADTSGDVTLEQLAGGRDTTAAGTTASDDLASGERGSRIGR